MNILGISCFYHDSAACLLSDGKLVAAVQEERFIRRRHCADFPIHAINYCIEAGGISFDEIDYVGFYEKPFLKFSRVITDHIRSFPFSYRNFLRSMPAWLRDNLCFPLVMQNRVCYPGRIFFIKHHMSHAAAAYLASPFDEAAVMTADGVGEWATFTLGGGSGTKIKIEKELLYPHSLGLLFSAVTAFLGFEANGGEGKVMGLAAYGEPVYKETLKKIITIRKDGSFNLDASYFGFNMGSSMHDRKFEKLFGPPRVPESELTARDYNLAASLQSVTEEIIVSAANQLFEISGSKNLCLAGGVFLNCLANHRILEKTPFEKIFIQPAAGDSGGALGAALFIHNAILGERGRVVMKHPFLGPEFSDREIRRSILNADLEFKHLPLESLFDFIARELSRNRIVGWFRGRMEFGPRALGNRSILASPCNRENVDILNKKVKNREPFRPFAPSVLEETAGDYFELEYPSPFMNLAAKVREEKKKLIPAVTHVDGTARVHTVSGEVSPEFRKLIERFGEITGIPVILNTSFNRRGEPVVHSPSDAIECFKKSGLDYLVMGNYLLEKQGSGS